jgi:hypothetical protein
MTGIEIQVGVGPNNSIEYLPFKKSNDDSIYITSCQCGLNSMAQVKKNKIFSSCIGHGFILFISFFFFYYIHMCIQCLGHFSPLPPAPSLTPLNPSLPGRNYFALISSFVEERV